MKIRHSAMTAALGIAALLGGATAGATDEGVPFEVALSGANEVPPNAHGDADRGSIALTLNPGHEQVCWSAGPITLMEGDPLPTAAHIHRAPAGSPGPIVIPLFGGPEAAAPSSYPTDTTCVPAARAVILEILRDPSAFYVNFHSPMHRPGVMRGQLAR